MTGANSGVSRATRPSRFAHMRGAPELINRSAAARDERLAELLWSLSERLTGTRFPLTAPRAGVGGSDR